MVTTQSPEEDQTSLPEEDTPEFLRGREDVENPDSKDNQPAGDSSDPRGGDLNQIEKTAAQHENQVGSGYSVSISPSGKFRFTKKKAGFGGGIIAIIISLAFMFTLTGPFQFVHLAQLLQQFHFSTAEDQTDVRAFRMIRFIKSGGDVREARVGAVASRLANKMEAKFEAAGYKYRGPGGSFDGFEVDENHSRFKGRPQAEIRAELDAKGYATEIREGKIVIPANERYSRNTKLIRNMMTEVGYRRISSAVQSRTVAGKWFGFTRWHPMRKVDAKINQTLAAYWETFKQKFNERVGKGTYGVNGGFVADMEVLEGHSLTIAKRS